MVPWSFKDGLKPGWCRRFVRVDLLCEEYELTREQLLSARDREPANHVWSKMDFQRSGPQPTHIAYNPDGNIPLAPGMATEDMGRQLNALVKRTRRAGASTGSSETLQSPSRIDNRATEAPTTEEQPRRRKKSIVATTTPKQLAALSVQNDKRQGGAARRYQEGLREATCHFDQSKWEEKRNGRSRALFADQQRPTMQPVVSPRLTNEYPLGVFNSRVKVVAELDARKVEYPAAAAYTALALILKEHEDVIISKVDGRKYLKRMGPSWESPPDDDEGTENELIANAMGNLT